MPFSDARPLSLPLVNTQKRKEFEAQFERLMAENRASLSRLAWSYTETEADREDLLQEIAVALWQALPGFRGECSERTFLYRIAQNRALHSLTNRRKAGAGGEDAIEIADPAPTAEASLSRQEQAQQLAMAVRRLPLLYRQVVVLVLEGLEYAEIADVLGITENNVGVRLNRARTLLRDMMGERR